MGSVISAVISVYLILALRTHEVRGIEILGSILDSGRIDLYFCRLRVTGSNSMYGRKHRNLESMSKQKLRFLSVWTSHHLALLSSFSDLRAMTSRELC